RLVHLHDGTRDVQSERRTLGSITHLEARMSATEKQGRHRKHATKYGKAASQSVERAMRERNAGTLRSGPGGEGGKVTSRKQAIAIGLSEARKKGAKVPRAPKSH